jgi:hypothetical protein
MRYDLMVLGLLLLLLTIAALTIARFVMDVKPSRMDCPR